MSNNNVSLKNDFKIANKNVNNSLQQDGSNFFSNSLQNPNPFNHRLNFIFLKFQVNIQPILKKQPNLIPLKPDLKPFKLQPKFSTQMKNHIFQHPQNLFMYSIPTSGIKNNPSITQFSKIKQVTKFFSTSEKQKQTQMDRKTE
jgi:hypothetical protein